MNKEFEKYVSEYGGDLTRLCISLCGNISDGEDLYQETWYKAIKYYEKFNKDKDFAKWLFSICVNTYKDGQRAFYNKKRINFNTQEEKDCFLNSIADVSENEREDFIALHSVISKLNVRHKIVLTMYYFKDYSIKEISKILNLPQGTVKSRLNAARKAIKRGLEYEK